MNSSKVFFYTRWNSRYSFFLVSFDCIESMIKWTFWYKCLPSSLTVIQFKNFLKFIRMLAIFIACSSKITNFSMVHVNSFISLMNFTGSWISCCMTKLVLRMGVMKVNSHIHWIHCMTPGFYCTKNFRVLECLTISVW